MITLSTKNLKILFIVFVFHFFILFYIGVTIKELLKSLGEPIFVAFVIILLKCIKFSSPYFDLTGLIFGLGISLRILSSTLLLLIFLKTTPITQVLALMNWLRVPLILQELIYLTLRFIKLWHEEIQTTYFSQKNRLGYRGFINSLRSLQYLIYSAFFHALVRSENSLQAMYQRGYDYRNLLKVLPSLNFLELGLLLLMCLTWGILCLLL